MRDRVIIGLSGGVDSSVSALILKNQGYEVIGFTFIQNIEESEDVLIAEKIAKKLDIKFIKINISKNFNANIVKYFLDYYKKGYTPSPCVICDDEVKFKILFDIADKYNAIYVATGHYANIEFAKKYNKFLLKKTDNIKDQSYMLYRLDEERLKRIIFPLANLNKDEVRKIAKDNELAVFNKADSQGLCFAKEGYKSFLEKNLPEYVKKGNYIDKYGKKLGEHEGYIFYTVGQRRGLGINFSKPVFVTNINPLTNEITLGEYEELKVKKIKLVNTKFNVDEEKLLNTSLLAKARFSSNGYYGKLSKENNEYFFIFDEENTHNTSGQHLVLYDDNFIVGGGEIRII